LRHQFRLKRFTLRKINIGIETRLLAGRMTGIGNYSFHLLKALIDACPELEYRGFGRVGWSRFDASTIRTIELHQNKGETAVDTGVRQKLIAAARRYASRSPSARTLYRAMHTTAFARTVGRESLDLFHALNFVPPADPGVVTLPVVYDLSFVRYPETHPKERLDWLTRLPAVIAKAPLIQTISEFSRNEIATVYAYPREKIFVAPPAPAGIFRPLGIDATRRGLAPLGLAPGAYLLAVGTLEPRKNLGTLVAAYGTLSPAERARMPLVIAGGSGWGNVGLPKQASELVQDGSLRFLGMVPDARLRDLYEGAVALLFPSLYEGFGMPVVEAMSCGTHVIHSVGTSMDEISADVGVRLPAMDVAAWANAVRQAIDGTVSHTEPSERERRIARARAFDWVASAARVRAAYANLLA
jgi:glycosyltransferase involved in cell wall biosynthesis